MSFEYTKSRAALNSSSIKNVWYNESDERLAVQFVGGNIAGYKGVSKELWDRLVSAASGYGESLGKLYNSEVRWRHDGFSIPQNSSEFKFSPLPEPVKAKIKNTYRVVALLSAQVDTLVDADSLEDAIATFNATISEGLGDNASDVMVSLKSVEFQ